MGRAIRDEMLWLMSAMGEAQAIALKEAQAAGFSLAKHNKRMLIKGANAASR